MSLVPHLGPHRSRRVNLELVPDLEQQNPEVVTPEEFHFAYTTDFQTQRNETRVDGAKVEYTVFEPAELTDDVPVYIRNGFFGSGPAYYRLGQELASQGKRAVITEAVRNQDIRHSLQRDVLALQAKVGYAVIKAVNNGYGTEQADIIGHSMGGITTTMLALRHPELVRSISYTGAAGQDNRHRLRDRALATPVVLAKEIIPNLVAMRKDYDPDRSMLLDTIAYGAHMIRTGREAVATSRTDDRMNMLKLRQDYGIKMAAVLMGNDHYFKPDEVIAASGRLFDRIYIIPGSLHLDPTLHPARHAALQLQVFDELNQPPQLRVVR